jgi:hypothetical protein
VIGRDTNTGGPASSTVTVKHCVSSPARLLATRHTPKSPAASGVQLTAPVSGSMPKPVGASSVAQLIGWSPLASAVPSSSYA